MSARPEIKSAIKRGTKLCAGAIGAVCPVASGVSRILTYHSIGARRHEMTVTTEAFRAQMHWLAGHVPVITLLEASRGAPGVAITFDDGFQDNLRNAAPILTELRLPATVFLVTGRMGGLLNNEPDPVNGRLMTWQEAGELRAMGLQLGAHTVSHARLSALTEEQQRAEIFGCQFAFEQHFGGRATVFAYPFGSALDYDTASVRLVREAGYEAAVSNRYGYNRAQSDPSDRRRNWIDASDSLTSFRAKVTGRLDLLRILDSAPGMYVRRRLNRLLRV